jgi:hypothetical protein
VSASRFLGMDRHAVPVATGPAIALPAGFGLLPGRYTFAGSDYNCFEPGLYFFHDLATGIYHRRALWTGDVAAFIKSVARQFVHGARDNARTFNELCTIAKAEPAHVQCGPLVDFMLWLLPQVGCTQVRKVQMFTGEVPPTPGDAGHVCFEEKSSGQWRLWDPDSGLHFADANGNHLSAKDLIALGVGNVAVVPFKAESHFVPAGVNGNYCELFYSDDDLRATWRERLFQIPAIVPPHPATTGVAYVPAAHAPRASWVASQGVSIVSESAWLAQFYPT